MTALPAKNKATDTPHSLAAVPDEQEFLTDVIEGLSAKSKTLPCKYFYDAKGSVLFDQITEQEAYYPTRTELSILEKDLPAITAALGPHVAVVEPGSGSSLKTRLLLKALQDPAAYIPVEISADHLLAAVEDLRSTFPNIPVHPVVADYTQPFSLPELETQPERVFVYYPGSTIGNFRPKEAVPFLRRLRSLVGENGGLLIGVDRKKDKAVLDLAYNDPAGVTEAFHLNLLHRINRELDGEFRVERFEHHAFYNEEKGRIEMHLRSLENQIVRVGHLRFSFTKGETICTEYSYKYTVEEFSAVAHEAGFQLQQVWSDEREYFSIYLFTV